MFGVREKPSFPLFIFFFLRIYLNVYNSVKKIQSLPRPTVTVPPPHTPATVPHSLRAPNFPLTSSFSTQTQTHKRTISGSGYGNFTGFEEKFSVLPSLRLGEAAL